MINKNNKRLVWADAFRGLLILLVVLGHSLQFGDFENRLSWNIINSFHIAAFFFISGFVGYKRYYKLSSINDKFMQLIIPFISWVLLGVVIFGGGMRRIVNALLYPDCAFWFIWVLFFIISLFILIRNIPISVKWKSRIDVKDIFLIFSILGLILIMVVTEFRLFGFQFFSFYFGFYAVGYWWRKFEFKVSNVVLIVLGGIWLFLALFWRKHEVPTIVSDITFIPASLLIYCYRYITAFVGTLFFTYLAMNFMNTKNIVTNTLCYIGKISLGIYIIHLFIGGFSIDLWFYILHSYTSILFVLLNFITQLIISVLLIKIIRHIPIVRLFLLGKK